MSGKSILMEKIRILGFWRKYETFQVIQKINGFTISWYLNSIYYLYKMGSVILNILRTMYKEMSQLACYFIRYQLHGLVKLGFPIEQRK